MIAVTALILAFNERENLPRALARLTWTGRVVVVDSFSTDDTVGLARAFPNVEVVQRRFDNHTDQWNFGLDQVRTPWVLTLDADYLVPPELAGEVQRLEPPADAAGYAAGFRYLVHGRPLRATIYPPRVVLFRRDRARYRPDGHTQRLHADGPVLPLTARVDHDDRKPLSRWLQSQDRYMRIEAPHLLGTPVARLSRADRLRRGAAWAPAVMFLHLLLGRGLILDGWPGLFYVFQRTLAETLLALHLLSEREALEKSET